MALPERKNVRLQNYDYSENGAYFVTICTKNNTEILSNIVGEGLCALPCVILTPIGEIVKDAIEHMERKYEGVSVDKYIIMPNHIHLIVRISRIKTGGHGDPPLQNIIGNFKSFTTHKYGGVLWQRSFYDHVIRDDNDYNEIWQYIESNAIKWMVKRNKE